MKKSAATKIWVRSAIVAACSFVVMFVLYVAGVFTFFENKTYDRMMVATAESYRPSEDIVYVQVDQESIDWAKEEFGWVWPWPREAYAQLIDYFTEADVTSIAFDILYTEPSVYGPEDDRELADAEANSGRVIQTVFITGEGTDDEQALFPIPEVKDNAALIGNITSFMDDDDIIRAGRLEYNFKGAVFPTLGTAPLYLEGTEDILKSVPRQKNGTALLRYPSSVDKFVPYNAKEILQDWYAYQRGEKTAYPIDMFEGMYVYVALYAPGLFDICSTPVSQVYPGVGVHLSTLDNLLNGSFIKRINDVIVIIWILLLSAMGAFFVAFAGTKQSQVKTVLIMVAGFFLGIGLPIGISFLLFSKGYYLVLINPIIAFLLSSIICVGLSFAVEGKQKRFIKSAFSQCLSKDVVNQIMNDPSSFTLGGKNFQMAAIFTDIQKFSSFSELLTAGELGALLNFYLTRMSDIIINEKGTVDKYEGDAIVALVGAPVEMDDYAQRACSAAVKMKKAEVELNKEIVTVAAGEKPPKMEDELYSAFKKMVQNNKTIFTRIGINSGEMIAGYFGSENKKNYTMMGNNVNLASRLEGVNKQYHTNGILISEATRNLLEDNFVVRRLDRVRVVNVNTPIRLYEVLDDTPSADDEIKAYVTEWEKFIDLFDERKYKEALDVLNTLSAKRPEDNVAVYYKGLLEDFFVKGKYPTEADDVGVAFNSEDGVFKLLQK